ncbi:hypothetical protein OG21DRAFT_14511 [Imleria badia]|nr:hypothetical protein OG21DRAFT_14511 [Imleria badia]
MTELQRLREQRQCSRSDSTEEGKRERDTHDLPNDTDSNWIESLPKAEVPDANVIAQPRPQHARPSPKSPPPPERVGTPASVSRSVATPQQALDDLHNRLEEQRHVITSLQTENSILQTSLARLDKIQAGEWLTSISCRPSHRV